MSTTGRAPGLSESGAVGGSVAPAFPFLFKPGSGVVLNNRLDPEAGEDELGSSLSCEEESAASGSLEPLLSICILDVKGSNDNHEETLERTEFRTGVRELDADGCLKLLDGRDDFRMRPGVLRSSNPFSDFSSTARGGFSMLDACLCL